jgi:hypothetical protein
MEYYSTIKKNGILLFAGKYVELENILSKVSQVQKDKRLYVFSHMWKIDSKDKCICKCKHDHIFMHIHTERERPCLQ